VLMLVTSLCMLFFFQRRYIHVISRATFSNSLLNKKRSPYSYLRTVFQHVVILVTFFLFLGVQALGYVFWVILMPPIWLFMISLLKKSMPQTDASSLTI